VCPDSVLPTIVDHPPADPGELDAVTGFGAITSRRLFPGIAAPLSAAQDGTSDQFVRSTMTGA